MTLSELTAALRIHPDAARPTTDADPHRVSGFLGLHISPCGQFRAEWHWGLRTFADQAELEGWLQGRTPASWQD